MLFYNGAHDGWLTLSVSAAIDDHCLDPLIQKSDVLSFPLFKKLFVVFLKKETSPHQLIGHIQVYLEKTG